MQISTATPPVVPSRRRPTLRRSYKELFDALRANPGVWLSIDPAEITGETPSKKQTILYISARLRSMKIETTHQAGAIYLRMIGEVSNA